MSIKNHEVLEYKSTELVDPKNRPMVGDDGKPMIITVYGPASKQYAAAQSKRSNRMVDTLKHRGKTKETPEEKAEEQAQFLADCTKEFSENIAVEYPGLAERDMYLALYRNRKLGFVVEQVGAFAGEWGNFMKDSTES